LPRSVSDRAIAAYGKPDNSITFYEINPPSEKLARDPNFFSYVDDCIKRCVI